MPTRCLLGRFHVLRTLGEGGMGLLLLAHDQDGGGRAVLKMPRQRVSRDRSAIARFEHEIALLRRLRHPRIPRWLSDGTCAGRRVLAVEHVEGLTVAHLVHRRAWLPAMAAAPIAADVLAALHATHSLTADDGAPLRALHRDVSPQNIIVDARGTGHLIDFGAATDATFDGAVEEGHVVGKAGYLAPEVVAGGAASAAADQFAAGIVLWEMLTGRRLFKASSDRATWRAILQCDVPSPDEIIPSIPRKLSAVVLRMLSPQPEERYPTCAAAAVALCFAIDERRLHLDGDELRAGRIGRARPARTVRLRPPRARGGGRPLLAVVGDVGDDVSGALAGTPTQPASLDTATPATAPTATAPTATATAPTATAPVAEGPDVAAAG